MTNTGNWTDEGTANMIYALLGQQWEAPTLRLPALCPRCGQIGVHMFFHTHVTQPYSRGGGWAWCSMCHGFGHGTWKSPPWWRNCPGIQISGLYFVPWELDEMGKLVDAHWNLLLDQQAQARQ